MSRLTGLGLTVKSPSVAGGTQTITGPHIASTAAVYAPMFHRGAIQLPGVTHYEGSGISAASFDHETPAGDDRLLVVVAVYKDTAGIASLVFGSNGTGDGEFLAPYGIAVDSDGYIYATDFVNFRIQKFDSAGAFVTKWGSIGTGDGEFSWIQGVAVAPNGAVYVSDYDLDRIQKFDADGAFITKWGSSGTGDGQMLLPSGVAVAPDGSVYVADSGNSRIQKFDADGAFITKWGSSGTGDEQFDIARGIAVAPDGSVYVVDSNNSRIQKFDADGAFITKWGTAGSGAGQFSSVNDIAADAVGAVYTIESGNDRIQKFNANLKLNTARYGGEEMSVGPLVDSGSYFVAFYSLENPAVGTAEVAFAAPTEPDIIMLTAISLTGVDTANTDYTGPNAGMAEQEAHTTQLQVSHNRTYPTNTLSLFALLYETASQTITGASGNHVWIERSVGDLKLALGLRPIPNDTTGSITFGATASGAVTPYISSVLHIEGARGHIDAPHIAAGAQVFAPVFTHAGQTIYPGTIAATSQVYAPSFHHLITGPTIASTAAVYAPAFATEPGATQYIELCFIGGGTPSAFNGPHIASTAAVYAPAFTSEAFIEPEFVESGEQVFAPTFDTCLHVGSGAVYAPTFANA